MVSDSLKFGLFADNTILTTEGNEVGNLTTRMNEELSLVNQSSIQNRLKINTDKIKLMLISYNTETMIYSDLKCGDGFLRYTTTNKFLGVTVDEGLKFNAQVLL